MYDNRAMLSGHRMDELGRQAPAGHANANTSIFQEHEKQPESVYPSSVLAKRTRWTYAPRIKAEARVQLRNRGAAPLLLVCGHLCIKKTI